MSTRAKGTGSIFKPKGSRFYWIAYYSGGKRQYESTKSERKKDAQDLLTSKFSDIGKGIPVTSAMGRVTLREGLQAVIDDQRVNGRQSTEQTEQRIANHLLDYFAPDRRMSAVTTADLERYRTHRLIEQEAQRATVNRELAILRRAFRLAMRGSLLSSMPYVPMLKEDNARQGFFEREEFDAILERLPACLHPPLEFMYVTGWRKSEVFNLTVAQVDLQARTVRLEVGTTKSGEGRTYYLTEALHALLTKQLAAIEALKEQRVICPWVFHRPDGAPIRSLRGAWTAATVAAGYPGKLLHDFRRTAVRNLERAGVPRASAMKMVGHATESIYRRYAIQDETMLREASAKLEAWTTAQPPSPSGQRAKVHTFPTSENPTVKERRKSAGGGGRKAG
jgi:integrase